MARIKLLPCPFCGAPAEIVQGSPSPYISGKTWVVGCTNGTTDPDAAENCIVFSLAMGAVWFCSQRDAAEAWNKRAGP